MRWRVVRSVLIAGWLGVVAYGVWRAWLRDATIEGGPVLVYEIDVDHPYERGFLPSEILEQASRALESRVTALAPSAEVRSSGKRVEVHLPRRANLARVRSLLGRPARVEFKVVDDNSQFMRELAGKVKEVGERKLLVAVKDDGWTEKDSGREHQDLYLGAPEEGALNEALAVLQVKPADDHELALEQSEPKVWRSYYLYRKAEISNADIDEVEVMWDPQTGRPEVALKFSEEGGKRFADTTERSVGKKLAIILDGKIVSAPVIESRITGGRARITLGGFGEPEKLQQEARDLVAVLRIGALPAPIRLVEER